MSIFWRRNIPVALAFIVGMYLIFTYYIVLPDPIEQFSETLVSWGVVIVAFSITLGLVNVIIRHFNHVRKRTKEHNQWMYSIVLLFFLVLFLIVGLAPGYGINSDLFKFMYNLTYTPARIAIYSMLGFFMISASYRAFKARTKEALILLVAGYFIFFGNAPIFEAYWVGFPLIRDWLMTVPNSAANRGVMIVGALGSIVLAYRTLIGKEKGFLGATEE